MPQRPRSAAMRDEHAMASETNTPPTLDDATLAFAARVVQYARMGHAEELADLWRPTIETCIEAFTPQRCMFESNFPVDKVSGSYRVYWNAFKRLASGASESEKAALFHDTAETFYRLG